MTAGSQATARLWATRLPILGVTLFTALYFAAASLYPGGTRVDPHTLGYSHSANYWCDLLDAVSYSGAHNPGRPFALLATIVMPVSLIPLWFRLPVLSEAGALERRLVRGAGCLSMVLATLVFTPQHDRVIDLSAALGFLAFVVATVGLLRARRLALVSVALFALTLGLLNFTMWQGRLWLEAMPVVQKAAYAMFFCWVIATTIAIERTQRRGVQRASEPSAWPPLGR